MFNYLLYRILKRTPSLKVIDHRPVKHPKFNIIFLHGIAATSHTWRQTFNLLKKDPALQDFELLNCDLLGYGTALTADWLDYDYQDYLSALNKTIKKLKNQAPIILVGHSMGALIAARYSLQQPSRIFANILVSPPVLLPLEISSLPDRFYLKTYKKADKLIEKPPLSTLTPFVEKVTAFRSKYTKTPAFSKSMDHIVLSPQNFATFCKLKTPSFIIHGRVDPLVYKPNLVKVTNKNSHVRLLCTLGHHDINAIKRQKILRIIKEITK